MISNADRRHPLRGMILVASAATVWSSGGAIVRCLESADAWTTIFWRSFIACLTLLTFMAMRRGSIVKQFLAMGLPGVAVGASFAWASISLVIALRLTSVANTLMIMSAAPLFAAVLARLFLGETIRPLTYVTIAAVIGGFALLVGDSLRNWSLTGDLFAVMIAVGYATAILVTRRHRHIQMVPAACLGTIIATLVSLPLASPFMVTRHDFPILLLFGAGQLGLGLALFVTGAAMLPAVHTSLLAMLETILGTLWAWLFFGETLTPIALTGAAIVMISILANTLSEFAIGRRNWESQGEPVPPAP